MTSVEGEAVPFKLVINTAQAKGAVERWLLEVSVWVVGSGGVGWGRVGLPALRTLQACHQHGAGR